VRGGEREARNIFFRSERNASPRPKGHKSCTVLSFCVDSAARSIENKKNSEGKGEGLAPWWPEEIGIANDGMILRLADAYLKVMSLVEMES